MLLAVLALAFAERQRPSEMFREVLLDPIPPSVRHIRADRERWVGKHSYVLRFAISPDDFALLVRSGPFDEISYVEYDRGALHYGEKKYATSSVWLYEVPRGDREPSWFDLERWTRVSAYIAEKVASDLYNVRLLLYHEGRGEAYFLEHERRGTWGPVLMGKEYRKAKELERRDLMEGAPQTELSH